MIIGIGCDIVEHKITKTIDWANNLANLSRVFSAHELRFYHIDKTDRFISGRFAAKEAVLKCLGTGMRDGIALTDIHILRDEFGKPIIQIEGEVKKLALQLGVAYWHISITHTSDSSTALVIAECQNS